MGRVKPNNIPSSYDLNSTVYVYSPIKGQHKLNEHPSNSFKLYIFHFLVLKLWENTITKEQYRAWIILKYKWLLSYYYFMIILNPIIPKQVHRRLLWKSISHIISDYSTYCDFQNISDAF